MTKRGWGWLLGTLLLWGVVALLGVTQAALRVDVLRAAPSLAYQVLAWLALAAAYQAGLRTVGIEGRLDQILPLVLAAVHHREIPSTEGPSTWLAEDARARGHSASASAAGVGVARVAALWAFEIIFVFAFAAMLLHPRLKLAELATALLLISVALAPALATLFAMLAPLRAAHTLQAVEKRFGKWVPAGWAERRASQITDASLAITSRPGSLGAALAFAMLAHLMHLATLGTLLAACHLHVPVAVLCTIQAVSVISWMVPVLPQRAGFVEGAMVLAAVLMRLPPATALTAIIGYRVLSFWIPSWLGSWLAARDRRHIHQRAGDLSVRLVAVLTAGMGTINLVSGVLPAMHASFRALEPWLPLAVRHGSRLASVLLGFLLLRLSRHLWHRKRVAWILTVLAASISAIAHLLKGLDFVEAGLATSLALWLVALRSQFHARSDPPSVRQGLGALGAALLFTLAYGTLGFWLLARKFQTDFNLGDALTHTLSLLFLLDDGGVAPTTDYGRFFEWSIYIVGSMSLLYALFLVLRPVLLRLPATAAERERARGIVEAHGCSSLAPFALLPDKSYFFSPGGSVLAYVVKSHVALVLADPIGPAEDLAPALEAFRRFCESNDWTPALLQTAEETVAAYETAGFEACSIGVEAIVDVQKFTLQGGAARNMRSIINRVKKAGYRAEIHPAPQSDALLQEMRTISDEWLTMMHGTEKQFSLGWFDNDYLRGCPMCCVYDAGGQLMAFANILTEYRRNEATGDLMRRRRLVENGTMELLFVSLFEWSKAQGYASFSLGLCPLAGVGEKPEDPMMERALHHVYEHVNQFYNFKGLHAFKEKFHPTWSPRYLIYPPRSLPVVTIAMIRASNGDTFLWDSLRDLLTPKPKAAAAPTASEPAPG